MLKSDSDQAPPTPPPVVHTELASEATSTKSDSQTDGNSLGVPARTKGIKNMVFN